MEKKSIHEKTKRKEEKPLKTKWINEKNNCIYVDCLQSLWEWFFVFAQIKLLKNGEK